MAPAADVLCSQLVTEVICSFMPLPLLHSCVAPVCAAWLAIAIRTLQNHCEPHLRLVAWAEALNGVNTGFSEALRQSGMTAAGGIMLEYPGDELAQNALMVAKFRARALCAEFGSRLFKQQQAMVSQLLAIRHSVFVLQLVARARAIRLKMPSTEQERYELETLEMKRQLRDTDRRLTRLTNHCEGSAVYLKQRLLGCCGYGRGAGWRAPGKRPSPW
eukprot:TRINITY_DN5305_c0_g1_i2.p1 TRINITY_DN5305_c0_g1~~TRINITY_DN5305_c0_g1_i2.p1  ORF type:complete len:238 (+),score=54.72 TRINITY_DN5305_c0_g1_i2:65-715(+)